MLDVLSILFYHRYYVVRTWVEVARRLEAKALPSSALIHGTNIIPTSSIWVGINKVVMYLSLGELAWNAHMSATIILFFPTITWISFALTARGVNFCGNFIPTTTNQCVSLRQCISFALETYFQALIVRETGRIFYVWVFWRSLSIKATINWRGVFRADNFWLRNMLLFICWFFAAD